MAKIILFWCFENIIFWGRIRKIQVQFWHPSDLRLWRTGRAIYVKNWLMKPKCPMLLNMPSKKKSAKLLILLPFRTIYFQTFQCQTPCIDQVGSTLLLISLLHDRKYFEIWSLVWLLTFSFQDKVFQAFTIHIANYISCHWCQFRFGIAECRFKLKYNMDHKWMWSLI